MSRVAVEVVIDCTAGPAACFCAILINSSVNNDESDDIPLMVMEDIVESVDSDEIDDCGAEDDEEDDVAADSAGLIAWTELIFCEPFTARFCCTGEMLPLTGRRSFAVFALLRALIGCLADDDGDEEEAALDASNAESDSDSLLLLLPIFKAAMAFTGKRFSCLLMTPIAFELTPLALELADELLDETVEDESSGETG
jgi:hypothetical protein